MQEKLESDFKKAIPNARGGEGKLLKEFSIKTILQEREIERQTDRICEKREKIYVPLFHSLKSIVRYQT